MQISSENVTQKAFSNFYFLIHCLLFFAITGTIIYSTRQCGAFAKNLKTSSFGISSFSLFSWPLVWLKLFFVLFKSLVDLLASYVAHVWGKERLVCSKRYQSALCSYYFYFSSSSNGTWSERPAQPLNQLLQGAEAVQRHLHTVSLSFTLYSGTTLIFQNSRAMSFINVFSCMVVFLFKKPFW